MIIFWKYLDGENFFKKYKSEYICETIYELYMKLIIKLTTLSTV